MTIMHQIDDFLFKSFQNAKSASNRTEALKEEMIKYYTVGPYAQAMERQARSQEAVEGIPFGFPVGL